MLGTHIDVRIETAMHIRRKAVLASTPSVCFKPNGSPPQPHSSAQKSTERDRSSSQVRHATVVRGSRRINIGAATAEPARPAAAHRSDRRPTERTLGYTEAGERPSSAA